MPIAPEERGDNTNKPAMQPIRVIFLFINS
jgi:hypothetical protein